MRKFSLFTKFVQKSNLLGDEIQHIRISKYVFFQSRFFTPGLFLRLFPCSASPSLSLLLGLSSSVSPCLILIPLFLSYHLLSLFQLSRLLFSPSWYIRVSPLCILLFISPLIVFSSLPLVSSPLCVSPSVVSPLSPFYLFPSVPSQCLPLSLFSGLRLPCALCCSPCLCPALCLTLCLSALCLFPLLFSHYFYPVCPVSYISPLCHSVLKWKQILEANRNELKKGIFYHLRLLCFEADILRKMF